MDEIKKLAEEALRIQNKDLMDATLRQIVKICERPKEASDVLPRKIVK